MSKVKCPQCKKETEYDPRNPYRPFCSTRCQTLDLGQWADQKYIIHNPLRDESDLEEALQENPEMEIYLH